MTASTQPVVLVGVDGSKPSEQALRWAAHLAPPFGARIVAIGAWDFPVGYGYGVPASEWNPAADTKNIVDSTVHAVFGDELPAHVATEVHEGGAARVLVDASAGASLLIVGSRGHGGFAGLLLGSVSTSVAEHAKCPVLVVHGDQPPPGE